MVSSGFNFATPPYTHNTGHWEEENEAKNLANKILDYLNKQNKEFGNKVNVSIALYGTPGETLTDKFAKACVEKFGHVGDGTVRDYLTNSYHIPVFKNINAFDKLSIEAEFSDKKAGGSISYVELPNMSNNIEAVLELIEHIGDTCLYAESNSEISTCGKFLCRRHRRQRQEHHSFKELTTFSINKQGLLKLDSFIDFLNSNLESKTIGSECDAYHILAIFICYQRIYIECYHFLAFFANGADRQVHQDSSIYIICIVDAYGGKQDRHTAGSIALRAYHFIYQANTLPQKGIADLLIESYGLEEYSNRELERAEEIFEKGYNTATELLDRLLLENGTIWR